jgi:hypothetical protein
MNPPLHDDGAHGRQGAGPYWRHWIKGSVAKNPRASQSLLSYLIDAGYTSSAAGNPSTSVESLERIAKELVSAPKLDPRDFDSAAKGSERCSVAWLPLPGATSNSRAHTRTGSPATATGT